MAVFLVTRWPFKALLGEEELPIGQDHNLNSRGLSSVLRGGISASALVHGEVGVSEGLLFLSFTFSHISFFWPHLWHAELPGPGIEPALPCSGSMES